MIVSNTAIRETLPKHVQLFADTVTSTLGPGGKNVLIRSSNGWNFLTKDGVTVSDNIFSEDEVVNSIYSIIKDGSKRTLYKAGDGTTTSMLIANTAFQSMWKYVQDGKLTAFQAKQMLNKISTDICNEVDKLSIRVSPKSKRMMTKIAKIASNGDNELSNIIAEAITKTNGLDGSITISSASTPKTAVTVNEGIHIMASYGARNFVNTVKGSVAFERPSVICYDGTLSDARGLMRILNKCLEQNIKQVFIFCAEVEPESLSTLVLNHMKGIISAVPVKITSVTDRAEILDDIAFLTGATVIGENYGSRLDEMELDQLGVAAGISVDNYKAILFANKERSKEDIAEYAKKLEGEAQASGDREFRARSVKRLARLRGGIGTIFVGADTEPELKERRDRCDDAVCAVRSALEEGVVAGGGTSLIKAYYKLCDNDYYFNDKIADDVLKQICFASLIKLRANLDLPTDLTQLDSEDLDIPVRTALATKKALVDIHTLTVESDCIELGVVDPTLVVKCTVRHGLSIAGILVTTDFAVIAPIIPQEH